MNPRAAALARLAASLVQAAEAVRELAALEAGPAPATPRRRRRARTLYAVRPGVEVDEVAAAQARKALSRYPR